MNQEMNADKVLALEFKKNFSGYKDVPMVLYGVGEKTKAILEYCTEFTIAGLMDQELTGENIYNLEVISVERVVDVAKIIVIVANISSCHIIYSRISRLVEKGIQIFYINGVSPETTKCANVYDTKSMSYEEIVSKISNCDIVSFDVFDTLIMRKTYYPTDIFELLQEQVSEKHGISWSFKKERVQAEKRCRSIIGDCYTIEDIYTEIEATLGCKCGALSWIKELEFQLEVKMCIPRDSVCKLMKTAIRSKKRVVVVSDTYWTKRYMKQLLKHFDIYGYESMFVSCEEKKTKHNGNLWADISKKFNGNNILHIGDNFESDVKNANEQGIEGCYVPSALELIKYSSLRCLLEDKSLNLYTRCALGVWMAKAYNNPFKDPLEIKNMYDFGYLFFGPMVLDFIFWIIRNAKESKIERLLFFARDGFVLMKAYNIIRECWDTELPEALYFLTSRRAATVATIEGSKDIEFLVNEICNVKKMRVAEAVFKAFNVHMNSDDAIAERFYYEVEKSELSLHLNQNYAFEILKNAQIENEGYSKYISKMNIATSTKCGCVNYVGRGVTQLFVERLIGKEMSGYYFATERTLGKLLPNRTDIRGRHGNLIDPDISKKNMISNYLLGEIIFTSSDEQLMCFDKKGNPIYENTECKRNIASVLESHEGILNYIREFMDSGLTKCSQLIDEDILDQIFEMIFRDEWNFPDEIIQNFAFRDYYQGDTVQLLQTRRMT